MEKIQAIFNFDNIGGKIKNFAKWSCWITILLIWIAAPIAFIALVADDYTAELCWIPLVGAIVCPVFVWIGSWAMYAFGEFVEDIHAMRNKECPTEQTMPSITIPKQTVNLYTSINLNKKAKAFSVLAGIFFVVSALLSLLSNVRYIMWGIAYISLPLLSSFIFILLGAFLFKKSQKGIVIGWASLAVVTILSFFIGAVVTSRIMLLITIANYLLFMLLTVFQKKLFRNKIVQFAVFLLPLEYGFFSFVTNWHGFLGLLGIGINLLGLVFFLLYLISANSVEKTTLPEESQTQI